MSPNIEKAMTELDLAIERLQSAVESQIAIAAQSKELESQVHTLNADRARLADRLDKAESRIGHLGDANRDVSTRIVAAMETIREVLESSREGS